MPCTLDALTQRKEAVGRDRVPWGFPAGGQKFYGVGPALGRLLNASQTFQNRGRL